MKDIYDIVRAATERPGQAFALATLVRAEGSSYRRPGARMLICQDGHFVGSLSGGCLEEEVALHAQDVLATGCSKTVTFDTRRRFGCNGKIDIFVEKIDVPFFVALTEYLRSRRPCTVVTCHDADHAGGNGSRVFPSPVGEAVSFPSPGYFVQEIHPPIRLLTFGGGHDSVPLRAAAELLGWQTVELAAADSLPTGLDAWTVAVVKSHNYGRDFSALCKLLPLNLPYVGLVGPRQRRDQLANALLDVGVPMNAGFFAPAGLDLGAETPEEIALAIVSEIQRVLAGKTGESLRERKTSIHLARPTASPSSAAECETSAL